MYPIKARISRYAFVRLEASSAVQFFSVTESTLATVRGSILSVVGVFQWEAIGVLALASEVPYASIPFRKGLFGRLLLERPNIPPHLPFEIKKKHAPVSQGRFP
jgi:hypothetical protein